MPEICRFYGIIVAMFYDDHNPPHFHARYGDDKIVVEINSLTVLDGHFPPRALGLVIEWASQHKQDLLGDWELAKNNQLPRKINPLK
jgi:phosphomannomutase